MEEMGLEFEIMPADIDEKAIRHEIQEDGFVHRASQSGGSEARIMNRRC